jgi:hypothetical protein
VNAVAVIVHGGIHGYLTTRVNARRKIITILTAPVGSAKGRVSRKLISVQIDQRQMLLEGLLQMLDDPIPNAIGNLVVDGHGVELVGHVLGLLVFLIGRIQEAFSRAKTDSFANLIRIGTRFNQLDD